VRGFDVPASKFNPRKAAASCRSKAAHRIPAALASQNQKTQAPVADGWLGARGKAADVNERSPSTGSGQATSIGRRREYKTRG